jgi:hypothetical protein
MVSMARFLKIIIQIRGRAKNSPTRVIPARNQPNARLNKTRHRYARQLVGTARRYASLVGPGGKASPTFDLGTIGNIISGLVGGGVLGQIVTLALPSVVAAAQSGNLSIGGIVSQVIAGGAGGAILTAIIGAIKNKAMA